MHTADNKRIRREYTRTFYRNNWGALLLSMLKIVIFLIVNLGISWLLQVLIDVANGTAAVLTLGQTVLATVALILLMILGSMIAYYAQPRFVARAMSQYKEYIFQKISQKGIAAFTAEDTSFYISALSNDTAVIETGYLGNIFSLTDSLLMFVGALSLMLWYSPLLSAVGIVLALLPVAASLLVGNTVALAEKAVSEKNEGYMSTLRDSLSGFSVVKSFRAEAAMCRLFSQQVKAVAHAQTLRGKALVLVGCLGGIAGIIAQFGVFIVGAWMVLEGYGITAGALMAFVNLMNYVVNPIGTVPQSISQFKAACALIDKLAAALSGNIREEGTSQKSTLDHAIILEDLSFGYEPEKPVLQAFSFTFEAGRSYAVVGASGSGKSTLMNLLVASHQNYTGSIRYDDTELKDIGSSCLYSMVSVIQQNVFIFNASIQDNITMFSPFSKEEVDRAIALSGLSALIDQKGEAYLCGENGSGLSGGEKQRISIARSLLKHSHILLADEATAALDRQTGYQVIDALLNLDDMTRIVVTHTLDEALLKRYDCILTLKNGRLAESGSFDSLMAQKGYFYSLYTVSQ